MVYTEKSQVVTAMGMKTFFRVLAPCRPVGRRPSALEMEAVFVSETLASTGQAKRLQNK
jgi:hypothetical protein